MTANRGGEYQSAKQFCPAQHEYTPENTYVHIDKKGRRARHCRKCMRAANQRAYAKARESK